MPNIADIARRYDPADPYLIDNMWSVVGGLLEDAPVFHSDYDNGFWVVTRYDDVRVVLQDPYTFSSNNDNIIPAYPDAFSLPEMPPMQTDPPRQRDYRILLNPYLSPQYVARYEPGIRCIVTDLLDLFIADGRCDFVADLARPFPARVLYQLMFGIESVEEVARCAAWTHKVNFEADKPDFPQAMAAWHGWITDLIDTRRSSPRRDDILDALIFGTVQGERVPDIEIVGAIMILVLGGFGTTADAAAWTTLRLARDPELQDAVRHSPDRLPVLIDESLRIEPPVINTFRICRKDTEIGGQKIRSGERVLVHLGAANHDPRHFDSPDTLDADRRHNKHLSFGAGPHRCIGSNLARLNLRILFEEVLSRMGAIRVDTTKPIIQMPANAAWGLATLPVTFQPLS